MRSAENKLTVALAGVGGTSRWAGILTILGSQNGNTQQRFVSQGDGKTLYKSPTFPAARAVNPVPPEEAWAPGMTAALGRIEAGSN